MVRGPRVTELETRRQMTMRVRMAVILGCTLGPGVVWAQGTRLSAKCESAVVEYRQFRIHQAKSRAYFNQGLAMPGIRTESGVQLASPSQERLTREAERESAVAAVHGEKYLEALRGLCRSPTGLKCFIGGVNRFHREVHGHLSRLAKALDNATGPGRSSASALEYNDLHSTFSGTYGLPDYYFKDKHCADEGRLGARCIGHLAGDSGPEVREFCKTL